jgi:hypothetical protein
MVQHAYKIMIIKDSIVRDLMPNHVHGHIMGVFVKRKFSTIYGCITVAHPVSHVHGCGSENVDLSLHDSLCGLFRETKSHTMLIKWRVMTFEGIILDLCVLANMPKNIRESI